MKSELWMGHGRLQCLIKINNIINKKSSHCFPICQVDRHECKTTFVIFSRTFRVSRKKENIRIVITHVDRYTLWFLINLYFL